MKMRKATVLLILFLVFNIAFVIHNGNRYNEIKLYWDEFYERCDKYSMCNKTQVEGYGINGIYFREDKYYCVWIENRDMLEIKKTDCHEFMHYYLDTLEGREHFNCCTCQVRK